MLVEADGCEATKMEQLESRLFFIPFSVGMMVWAFQKIDTVFELVFFEFAIYNVVKEIVGVGSVIDLWEILFWVIALFFTWYKFRKRDRS